MPVNLAESEDWQGIKSNWERLRVDGLNWSAEENFAVHTRLIDQLLIFKIVVSGEYVLPLDPQIDSAYLIDVTINRLPMALEHLGQIRAFGTVILSRRHITEQQEVMMKTLIAQFGDEIKFIKIDFDKVARNNPALQISLRTVSESIDGSARELVHLVESDMLTKNFHASPEDFYIRASAAIDNGYAQMYETLLPEIETLIKARIAQSVKVVYTSVGIAFVLFLAAAYFSIGIYYATIGSIRSLARSARIFAGGDLRERIILDTRDELSQIGDSFNEMADGFDSMLEARKHAEALLAKESYKNEMLLRAASDGIHILDLDGNVLQVSDRFGHMLGYTAAEMIGMNVAQWDVQMTAAELNAKVVSLGSDAEFFETRHRRRDGGIIDVEVSVVKVKIDGQQLVYCALRDVTERKQIQAELQKSERAKSELLEKLDEAQYFASIGSWEWDLQTNRVWWSEETYHIFGVTPQDFTPSFDANRKFIHPDDSEKYDKLFDHSLQTGEPLDFEIRLVAKGGGLKDCHAKGKVIFSDTGQRLRFIGTIMDITDRKQAERVLIESRERLNAVIETAMDAVVQMDSEGVITHWNPRAESILAGLGRKPLVA